jgi:hypothetical protein
LILLELLSDYLELFHRIVLVVLSYQYPDVRIVNRSPDRISLRANGRLEPSTREHKLLTSFGVILEEQTNIAMDVRHKPGVAKDTLSKEVERISGVCTDSIEVNISYLLRMRA